MLHCCEFLLPLTITFLGGSKPSVTYVRSPGEEVGKMMPQCILVLWVINYTLDGLSSSKLYV